MESLIVQEHLPDSVQEFRQLGLVRDGIYKRIEFAIEDVFDICAILNTDLGLGVPGEDEDILVHLVQDTIITSGMHEKIKGMRGSGISSCTGTGPLMMLLHSGS